MRKTKILIAMAIAATIFLSMFSAINMTRAVSDPSSFYTVANGNLNTDTYTQYPFEANNVSFGFSQFGELIGIAPGANQAVQGNWVGMSYNGRDPFAPNTTTIPQNQWINGWFLYISYIDTNEPISDRNLWAFALFSDGHVAGGNWVINVTGTPSSTPYGGRKTNGMVITDPLQVLYNGPREYIAQATNHIYDNDGTYQWPVVDLIITMIFDKVSKQVILYKDVKTTIDKLNLWGKLNVQLSDREEYDMGSASSDTEYSSYATFYPQEGYTSLTPSWSIAQNLTTDYIETQTASASQTLFTLHPPNSDPVSLDYMKVYVNGVFQDPSVQPVPYTVNYGLQTTVTLTAAPGAGATVVFKYKFVQKSSESLERFDTGSVPSWTNEYDYAQVISSDNQYVAWAAFWPPTSSHTVDGILNFLQPLYDLQTNSLSSAPKRSPLIIGQWDIAMDPATFPMFRAVEVKGICNYHNAQDPSESVSPYIGTRLDVEAQYQLDSVFVPYDLKSAIDNNLNTWVDYYTVTANDLLGPYLDIYLSNSPVHLVYPWETYNSQSERVFLDGVLQYPIRNIAGYTATYELYLTPDGVGYVEFPTSVLSKGDVIKIIYSTETKTYEDGFSVTSLPQNALVDDTGGFDFSGSLNWPTDAWSWVDWLNVQHDITIKSFDGTFTFPETLPTGNTTWTYTGTMNVAAKDITVFKEDTGKLEVSGEDFSTETADANGTAGPSAYEIDIAVNDLALKWEITPPGGDWFSQLMDVQFSLKPTDLDFTIYVTYEIPSVGSPYWFVTAKISLDPIYSDTLYREQIPGRYEWGIVGSNAKSVDSAGLSMITAALKDKEIEYGIAGEDIAATDPTLYMPSVFSQVSTLTTTPWSPYYYSAYDLRTALADDYDPPGTMGTNWQIAGANLVGSGGPLVNMLAYYGNDFATAFYGISTFTPYGPWNGAVIALSSWNDHNKGVYTSAKTGYAVISTFEDLNGTRGLLIYGVWGRDTYYAANYFYADLIQEFQTFPCGATSIVLQIDYNTTTQKPTTFTVVNVLGTVSETGINSVFWVPYVWSPTATPLKGGIHPDP